MELYLKRFFWVVPIVVVITCSMIAARAANHVLEAALLLGVDKTKSKPGRRPRAAEPTPARVKDDTVVAERNLFCSTCTPAAAQPAASPTAPVDPNNPPLTQAPIALVATLIASEPSLSAATIVNTQTSRTGSYRIDDVIPDLGAVKKIRGQYVDFENKGRLERVQLSPTAVAAAPTPPPDAPPPAVASPTPPPGGTPDAAFLAELDKGIRKVDDTHFDVDRALVDKVLNDTSLVARAARIVPAIQGGKPNGFKLYAIRPNSPFAKLGLQNGDTIQVVNGFEVTGFDKALEVMTKIRSASNLSVQIMRRGQPQTMEYSIK